MKLNLGCGRNIIEGWVNLDLVDGDGVDVVADLDIIGNTLLPFGSDSIDEFYASHLLEHLKNPLPFMQELHRISKPEAKAIFRVPYGSSDDAFEDPTHVRQYFMDSFGYFTQPYYWRADYGYRGDWNIDKIVLSVDKNRFEGKPRDEIIYAVRTFRNTVYEMTVTLSSLKPIREPKKELQQYPGVDLKFV